MRTERSWELETPLIGLASNAGRLVCATLTALALTACAGTSSSESAADQAAPLVVADGAPAGEQVAGPLDPIKCEKMTPTGTRISYKVCKKQSEWDAIRRGSQALGEEVQRRATHSNDTRD